MTADEFRKAAHAAIEESPFCPPIALLMLTRAVISYNDNITNFPVLPKIEPGYLAPQLPTTAPDSPQAWSEIQPDIAEKIIPGLTHWQSPNFMNFYPAGVTYPSILGEMYSAAFTAPAFNWLCSPACTELETIVLDWLAKALSLPAAFLSGSPSGGGGVIQGSASEAIVTCMVAARERYVHAKCDAEGLANPSPERNARIAILRPKLIALSSDQTHSSTAKGAAIAGTLHRSIKTSLSQDAALTGSSLESTLDQVRSEGLEPYYITLTIGTTSTCSIDDFPSLNTILSQPSNTQIWQHIDAAYAGSALILPEHASTISPMTAQADSFNVNMHKWLLVNFDASCLFVQNRNHLTRALSISAPYYQNSQSDAGLVTDYRDWQIPLGRRFRALKIWFVMRSYGLQGMRDYITYTCKLGDMFAESVRSRPDLFEIIAKPQFALTCFRVRPSALSNSEGDPVVVDGTTDPAFDPAFDPATASEEQVETEANAVTKEITDLINASGEVYIGNSSVAGKTFIRVVSANPQAQEIYVRRCWDIVLKTTEEVLEKRRQGKSKKIA